MSKKDYELIARIIADIGDPELRALIAHHFADRLRAANPRFNIRIFLAACADVPRIIEQIRINP